MTVRCLFGALALSVSLAAGGAEPVKVGVVAEMSGAQAEYGLQMTNGIKVYMQEHGDTVAGRHVELIVRDVGGPNPEVAKRLAQELVTREHVDFLAGFGFSPNALAAAPVATEAKIPMVVMNAAASVLTTRSPYIVRVSMTIAQNAMVMGDWASKNGIKTAYILYADYCPG
jgi:branched-chain amino acid transport system substrate-binding protein